MTSDCDLCGAQALEEVILPEYDETLSGLRVRLIDTVRAGRCAACGADSTLIPDLHGLAAAAAVARVLTPIRLGATDLRFFRAALDMNSKAFAEVMQLTPETVSRWEAENGKGVGHSSETSVRLCVLSLLREQAPFIACNPADIVRMRARPLAEGEALPVLTFERVKVREGGNSRVIWEERLAA